MRRLPKGCAFNPHRLRISYQNQFKAAVYTRAEGASNSSPTISMCGWNFEFGYNRRLKKPGWRSMEFEFLEQLQEKWEPVSKWALIAWVALYALFLLDAARATDGLIIDNVNLVVHESGHLLFGWLGSQTIMV